MKKLLLLAIVLSLTACSSLMSSQVKYEQQGRNCKYTEITGSYEPGIFSDTYKVLSMHEVIYPDMMCREVVQSDLKHGINKNTTSPFSIYRIPVFGYEKTVSPKQIKID